MADLGFFSLFLALLASLVSGITFILGFKQRNASVLGLARTSLFAACGLFTIASAVLMTALLTHNFQFEYVASYSSRDLGLGYLLSAFWAGNAGSLLFWGWLLSILAAILIIRKRSSAGVLLPYASAVIMFTQAFLVLLMLFAANPFAKLPFTPVDGNGLNPLLQNPGMLIHPVTLLIGYVGFTIPFAFGLAALFTRRLDDTWLVETRHWTLFAWLMLTLGNIIGAWWAYNILGWGGYWGWDPVENSSLMPWLTGTALLHSSMMQRRRGMLKLWTMALAMGTFLLCFFGTYITRSGVLQTSVHAWTDQTSIGYFFIGFMLLTLGVSVAMLVSRAKELRDRTDVEALVSPESSFLLNNLLLVGSTFAVLAGVTWPLISGAFTGTQSAVDAGFYNQLVGPLFVAIVLLAGVCTAIGWRRRTIAKLGNDFLWPGVLAVGSAIGLVIVGMRQVFAVVPIAIAIFVVSAIVVEWARGVAARRKAKDESLLAAFSGLFAAARPRYGGYIVHIGIALLAVGIIGSSMYQSTASGTLTQGQQMNIGQYTLTYEDFKSYETGFSSGAKQVDELTLRVQTSNASFSMTPNVNYFPDKAAVSNQQGQKLTHVAIRAGMTKDLYVILDQVLSDGTARLSVFVNPLVAFIWIGGTLMGLGGLLAYWPSRRKFAAELESGAGAEEKVERRIRQLRQPKAGEATSDEIEKRVRQLRQLPGGKPAPVRPVAPKPAGTRPGPATAQKQFCTKCGKRVQPEDRFCTSCGTKV